MCEARTLLQSMKIKSDRKVKQVAKKVSKIKILKEKLREQSLRLHSQRVVINSLERGNDELKNQALKCKKYIV